AEVKGDRVGLNDREGGLGDPGGCYHACAGIGDEGPVIGPAGNEVHADELGDVAGAWPGGDLGEGTGLDDAARFEDYDAIGQSVGVYGIVGHEQVDAIVSGQMAAQIA